CAIAAPVYLPLRSLVIAHRRMWTHNANLQQFWNETISALANHLSFTIMLAALLIYGAVCLVASIRIKHQNEQAAPDWREFLIIGLIVTTVSYYLLVFALTALGMSSPPFARNGMFAFAFLWLALLLMQSTMPRWPRALANAAAVGNAVWGLVALFLAFSPGR